MVTLCWAVKGGSGTTVVAAALALNTPRRSLLVDLDGELPTVLGIPEPGRPGVADWLVSSAPAPQLAELIVHVSERTSLLPWRAAGTSPRIETSGARWAELAVWMTDWATDHDGYVVVDGGTREPPAALHEGVERSLLVTRPCYLALSRAGRCTARPNGIVLVDEPGHALGRRTIEHTVGAPIEATISVDPAVARAVDAGLLACSLPRGVTRVLRTAAA